MKLKEVKRLSIMKWKYIVETGISDRGVVYNNPELLELQRDSDYDCAMCYYDDFVSPDEYGHCKYCPLANVDKECSESNSAYKIWFADRTKENAQVVLNLIKSIKVEEDEQEERQEKEKGQKEESSEESSTN